MQAHKYGMGVLLHETEYKTGDFFFCHCIYADSAGCAGVSVHTAYPDEGSGKSEHNRYRNAGISDRYLAAWRAGGRYGSMHCADSGGNRIIDYGMDLPGNRYADLQAGRSCPEY